ncbi:hypothetical protein ACFZC6_29420 [Streptomyces ossamyceticus]|uniref:Uncharacterized protein n=1 Tax=Streptomyces ossamyceticus TaxID=249581 RepID=A0ABV2V1W3_9ACTN
MEVGFDPAAADNTASAVTADTADTSAGRDGTAAAAIEAADGPPADAGSAEVG